MRRSVEFTAFVRLDYLCHRPSMADVQEQHARADALYEARQFGEALAAFQEALAANPGSVPLQFNIGNTLRELKRYREAVAAYDMLLAATPNMAIAHHNRATCLLHLGDLQAGFREYEWRKHCPGFVDDPRYTLARPWAGESLRDKTLYIYGELFQGDLLMFGRYALLAERSLHANVVLSAPWAMHAILQTMSPTIRLISDDAPAPDYDFQCAMMSMPRLCHTSLDAVPALPSYIHAEPSRIQHWRSRIGSGGLKIGLAWQGSERATVRSFPLAVAAERLAGIPGVRLICLQKGLGLEQLDALPAGQVETLGNDFDDGTELFLDTAAAMTCCDLFITPDTSVVHIGGALGVRTWLAAPWAVDWRWLENRATSPWYPSVRIFRQPTPGNWAAVFDQMATAIVEATSIRSGARGSSIET